jgi:hypothetical protein
LSSESSFDFTPGELPVLRWDTLFNVDFAEADHRDPVQRATLLLDREKVKTARVFLIIYILQLIKRTFWGAILRYPISIKTRNGQA